MSETQHHDPIDKMRVEVRPGDIVIRKLAKAQIERRHATEYLTLEIHHGDLWEARCVGTGRAEWARTPTGALRQLERGMEKPRPWWLRWLP